MIENEKINPFVKNILEQYEFQMEKKIRKKIADEIQTFIKYGETEFDDGFNKGLAFAVKTINKE